MTKPTPERETRGVVAEGRSVGVSRVVDTNGGPASEGRAMTDTVVNTTAGDELDLDAAVQPDTAADLDVVQPEARPETEGEAAERKAQEKADVDEALATL